MDHQNICMCSSWPEYITHCTFNQEDIHVLINEPHFNSSYKISADWESLNESTRTLISEKICWFIYFWDWLRRQREVEEEIVRPPKNLLEVRFKFYFIIY